MPTIAASLQVPIHTLNPLYIQIYYIKTYIEIYILYIYIYYILYIY